MSRTVIDDLILRIFVGIKSEAGTLSTAQVRGVVGRMAADVRAPAGAAIVGFLELEDIPPERRGQFLTVLDTISQNLAPTEGN
jgi:hypothetical protein